MNKVTYGVVREEYSVDGESRISYGIAAFYDVEENGTSTIVASLHDISSDINEVTSMTEKCNKERLKPELLFELI